MDDSIPSISSGAVGSRFVTQTDLDSAKARRDEQWKAAYARLAAPPQPALAKSQPAHPHSCSARVC